MIPEDQFPVGQPQPRIDSFEAVEPDGPELTDEETAWPVAAARARIDSFDGLSASETDVVIRLRCGPAATAAEVSALVQRLRSVVAEARFPVEIILPSPVG